MGTSQKSLEHSDVKQGKHLKLKGRGVRLIAGWFSEELLVLRCSKSDVFMNTWRPKSSRENISDPRCAELSLDPGFINQLDLSQAVPQVGFARTASTVTASYQVQIPPVESKAVSTSMARPPW